MLVAATALLGVIIISRALVGSRRLFLVEIRGFMQVHQSYVGVSLDRISPLRVTHLLDNLVQCLRVDAFSIPVRITHHILSLAAVLPIFLLLLWHHW